MRVELKSNLSAVLITAGILGGNSVFNRTLKETNRRVLSDNGENPLDVNGDEELWLVLAQQYREYGTESKKYERDFKKQTNPGFLHSDVWKYYAVDHEYKNKPLIDESIADQLRERCAQIFDLDYEPTQYAQAKKWCSLVLPDYVRRVLKWQFNNGKCRLWLVADNNEGYYPWEALGNSFLEGEKYGSKTFLQWLPDSLEQDEYNVGRACNGNRNKILVIRSFKQIDYQGESAQWTADAHHPFLEGFAIQPGSNTFGIITRNIVFF